MSLVFLLFLCSAGPRNMCKEPWPKKKDGYIYDSQTEKTNPSIIIPVLTASLNLVHSTLPKQQIGQMTEIARILHYSQVMDHTWKRLSLHQPTGIVKQMFHRMGLGRPKVILMLIMTSTNRQCDSPKCHLFIYYFRVREICHIRPCSIYAPLFG